MTVGKKIQMYRKQLEMSQEELGKQLLVSRQTISLWEKDQTFPTIDNLMRLREIFCVSIDDLLDIEKKENVSEIEPNEIYQFNFTKKELNEIYRLQRKNIYRRPIIFTLLCILLIIFSGSTVISGFSFGMLFIGLVCFIKGISTYNKSWKNSIERICESTYEYKIFDDYIEVGIYRKNEKTRESKCYYTDIEQIRQFDKWLFFQFGGQSFIVRKNDLKENSVFISYMYKNLSKTIEGPVSPKWRFASNLLFIASLFSIFGALALEGTVSSVNNLFVENMWLFFLLTPIPIASIVLGFILKSKGYKYRKNIIVGIIMSALLCIYGSFSFIFANVYNHSDEPIVRIEQLMEIDLPIHKQINTQNWTKGTQSVSRGYIYYISDIYFDEYEADKFEKQLKTDDKWLSSIQNDLIGIASPLRDYFAYDHLLIYNVNTSEYNTLPYGNGTFRFINIFYRTEDNQMRVVEYDIDYIK